MAPVTGNTPGLRVHGQQDRPQPQTAAQALQCWATGRRVALLLQTVAVIRRRHPGKAPQAQVRAAVSRVGVSCWLLRGTAIAMRLQRPAQMHRREVPVSAVGHVLGACFLLIWGVQQNVAGSCATSTAARWLRSRHDDCLTNALCRTLAVVFELHACLVPTMPRQDRCGTRFHTPVRNVAFEDSAWAAPDAGARIGLATSSQNACRPA